MKKTLAVVIIGIFGFSMFSALTFSVKAEVTPKVYLTDLVQLTTGPYRNRAPFWSPDSSKIVYFAFAGTWYRNLWVMNADGSSKTQLTFGNVIDESGDYSPDGTKIVFMRNVRGTDRSDLMIMNADGTNVQQLTSTGLHRGQPRWSHNGQKLAFYYGGAGTSINEIHMMDVDGKNEMTLVSSSYPYMNVFWSPDDTKLVYSMDDGIWLVSTSSPYEKTHLFTTSQPTQHPVFSPNGEYILYGQGVIGQPQDLYLIDSNGNFVAQLTNDTKIDYPFDWSPNGQFIAFGSQKTGNTEIWRATIVIAQPQRNGPLWMQWYFWTNVALGITTAVFAFTTFHYRKKAFTPKESKSVTGKPLSREGKTCPNCGANLPADSKFCGNCGASLQ
jgi:Tol biopolymer transport system component